MRHDDLEQVCEEIFVTMMHIHCYTHEQVTDTGAGVVQRGKSETEQCDD